MAWSLWIAARQGWPTLVRFHARKSLEKICQNFLATPPWPVDAELLPDFLRYLPVKHHSIKMSSFKDYSFTKLKGSINFSEWSRYSYVKNLPLPYSMPPIQNLRTVWP